MKIKKNLIFFVWVTFTLNITLAQPALYRQRGIEVSYLLGYHFASNTVAQTGISLNGPVQGMEVSLVQYGLKNKEFTETYGNPRLGLSSRIFQLNHTDTFGYCISILPSYTLNFYNSKKLQIGGKFGYGIAYNTKKFSRESNFENRAISTNWNFCLDAGIRSNLKLNEYFQFSIGGGLFHVSNGSIKKPNGGINILYGQIGISYFPKTIKKDWNQKANYVLGNDKTNRWHYSGYLLASHRELGFNSLTKFWILGLSQQGFYRVNKLLGLGIGLDAFYDATPPLYQTTLKVYDIQEKEKLYLASGIYSRLTLGKLFVPLAVYHYFFQMKNVKEPVYLKFGLAHQASKHIFYGLFFKGTINQGQKLDSDFMEFSIGINY